MIVAVYVCEGWWHPNTKSGQVHEHPSRPNGAWSEAHHRLCEPVFTARPLPDTTGLGFCPLDEAWICDAHGMADCTQTPECAALPWEATESHVFGEFVQWARDKLAAVAKPYDEAAARGEDAEMPDEMCDAYWPADWAAELSREQADAALRQRQGIQS